MNVICVAGYTAVLCTTAYLFVYFSLKDDGKQGIWDEEMPVRNSAKESLQSVVYIMYISIFLLIASCWGRMLYKRKEHVEFINILLNYATRQEGEF